MEDLFKTVVVFIVACIAFAVFFGLPIMWLWNNCLVGAVDGIHEVSFTQALGIIILVELFRYKPTKIEN